MAEKVTLINAVMKESWTEEAHLMNCQIQKVLFATLLDKALENAKGSWIWIITNGKAAGL